ncbi:MAG: hypothetical protein IMW89_11815 [Ktedonobacteraceae bacterium]|nr:hypothetical protein [Ktedonobacteraceae bacterium]
MKLDRIVARITYELGRNGLSSPSGIEKRIAYNHEEQRALANHEKADNR